MKRLALLIQAYPLSALFAALAIVFFASAIVSESLFPLVVAVVLVVVAASPLWLPRVGRQRSLTKARD